MIRGFSVPSRLILAAALVGIIPGVAIAGVAAEQLNEKVDRQDPAANMDAEEQEADHDRLWAEYQKNFAAWLVHATSTDVDFSTLERVELQALVAPPSGTFSDAIVAADHIVVGTIDNVEFLPNQLAQVHVRVEETLKGSADQALTVIQAGGPQPATADWEGMVLAELISDPLLLPGDRAVLLIDTVGQDSYVQAHTGQLRISGDTIAALQSNPSESVLAGRSLEEVLTEIEDQLTE